MKRRSVGNVIAAAVMIFLMIFAVGQLYVQSINLLDDYNRVADKKFTNDIQKANEKIAITNLRLSTTSGPSPNFFLIDLTITNSGGAAAHIVSVWFNDVTNGAPHTRLSGSGVDTFIGQGLTATLSGLNTGIRSDILPNPRIAVKVFTELGNSVSVQLIPPGIVGTTTDTLATVQLTIVPPNPITGNNIVIVLTVTNNNNLGVAFTSLTPDIRIYQGTSVPSPYPTSFPASTCTTTSGTTTTAPVKCTLVSGPTPSSLSFLPFGTTITFQWIYQVDTIVNDFTIAVAASHLPVNTAGLIISGLNTQAPIQTALVRGPGGASTTSGGSFTALLGELVNFFPSFQFSQDQGTTWKGGQLMLGNTKTLLRINVTNIGSRPIVINATSEILLMDLSTSAAPTEFFVITPCNTTFPYFVASPPGTPNCVTGSNNVTPYTTSTTACVSKYNFTGGLTCRLVIRPGQTLTLYFASKAAAGSQGGLGSTVQSTPAAGKQLLGIIAMAGNKLDSSNNNAGAYTQAAPFFVVKTCTSLATC